MVRAPCCEKMGLKKGPWTPEEDRILIDYIQQYGHGNWRALPKQAGLLRCGKSCRLRWINYLRPDIKRGNFTREEEETIIELHKSLGNRWSAIAARLPGRTDNEIKNVWHTHLKKRLQKHQVAPAATRQRSKTRSKSFQEEKEELEFPGHVKSEGLEQSLVSPEESSSDVSTVTVGDIETYPKAESPGIFPEMDEDFWSEVLSTESSPNDFSVIGGDPQIEVPFSPLVAMDDGMDFWFNIFTRAGEVPELPEF